MTLAQLNGSWTRPSGRWDATAPFAGLGNPVAAATGLGILAAGRAAIAAVPKGKLLSWIALGLGMTSLIGAFGSEDSFDEGWDDGNKFDERMALMQQMWLKLNDRIAAGCPAFVESPGITEYRNDRERFSAFYAQTGKVTARASSYVGLTPSPSATEVGTAKAFWATLIGWIAALEEMCPGNIAPGLAEAFKASEHAADEAVTDWKWWILGGAGVVLAGLYIVSKRGPSVVVTGGGYQPPAPPRYSRPPPGAFRGLGEAVVDAQAVKMRAAADRMSQEWLKAATSRQPDPEKLTLAAERMRANWLKQYGLEGLAFARRRRRR